MIVPTCKTGNNPQFCDATSRVNETFRGPFEAHLSRGNSTSQNPLDTPEISLRSRFLIMPESAGRDNWFCYVVLWLVPGNVVSGCVSDDSHKNTKRLKRVDCLLGSTVDDGLLPQWCYNRAKAALHSCLQYHYTKLRESVANYYYFIIYFYLFILLFFFLASNEYSFFLSCSLVSEIKK